jgi:GTPase SAR1 family protein
MTNSFQSDYNQTFGAEMFEKSATDPKKWSFQIWTVGGSERYRTLLNQFYTGSRVALLCFDMMNMSSFQELAFWYNETKRNCPDATLVLVGLKAEEADSCAVKPSDMIKLVSDSLCSPKNGVLNVKSRMLNWDRKSRSYLSTLLLNYNTAIIIYWLIEV